LSVFKIRSIQWRKPVCIDGLQRIAVQNRFSFFVGSAVRQFIFRKINKLNHCGIDETMRKFAEIEAKVIERFGGAPALEARLTRPKSPGALRKIPDGRWLSEVSKAA
jgi:hypothetical protein